VPGGKAAPVVRGTTRFKNDGSGLMAGNQIFELFTIESVTFEYFSRGSCGGNFKNILCQINSNNSRLHDGLLL